MDRSSTKVEVNTKKKTRDIKRQSKYLKQKKIFNETIQGLPPTRRECMKSQKKIRYKVDLPHRERVKNLRIFKYRHQPDHRERVKNLRVFKYRHQPDHRQKLKTLSKKKYSNIRHKMIVTTRVMLRRQKNKLNLQNIDFVIKLFF